MSLNSETTHGVERDLLTRMFEADLELARDFNRVGELNCAREHLHAAADKLKQIGECVAPSGPEPVTTKVIDI